MISQFLKKSLIIFLGLNSGFIYAPASPNSPESARIDVSAVESFGQAPREEQESFFDSIKSLKGIPDSLKFPDTADDDTVFASKSMTTLTEIDKYLNDKSSENQNWVRRVVKSLKVKTGFSRWIKSINERITALEERVNSLAPETSLAAAAPVTRSATLSSFDATAASESSVNRAAPVPARTSAIRPVATRR